MMKYNDILLSQYRENERKAAEIAKRKSEEDKIRAKIAAENDIAPTYFQAGALSDGYKFGDVLRSVHGTVDDIYESTWAGILGMGEQVVDAGAYLLGGAGSLFGADEFADSIKEFIAGDLYDERKVANVINYILHPDSILADSDNSFFGDKTDSLLQSAGQLAGTAGLQALGVPWWLTTGITSFGGEVDNAFDQGASYGEAGGSALISAGAEVLLEKLSGGIKFGGKTLDDILLKPLVDKIGNKVGRTLINFGIDVFGEGGEELLSSVFSRLGSNLYKREDILKLLTSEEAMDEYLESFIGGMVISGGMNAGKVASSLKSGRDYNTGLTDNEQKVFDKVYEARIAEEESGDKKLTSKEKAKIYDEVMKDLKDGGIDIETINDVLGVNDSYKAYTEAVKNREALKDELKTLREMESGKRNDFQEERLNELKEMNLSDDTQINKLRDSFYSELSPKIKDSYLAESYNERARRNEKFTADLTKYKGKQAEIVQKAIDSGFLNNTRKTHALVDLIAKVGGDKDIGFDFTNNEKLKNSGFAVEGRIINGYVTKDGVTVNINSKKALNSVVGHEITHVLEGTELYNELRNAVYEYSKTKGDYDSRRTNIEKLYEGIKDADVDAELTADLVGDYLFTDTDFVRSLSTGNRNLFEKLFDEIKYLCKVATAGSKEARQLEKVKKAFQDAYRESSKAARDDTNSLKQTGENATEQPTEVNLSEKLSPEDAQAMNIMASNIVKAAKTTGLFLDDYYKATENINAFNPTRADANALADALAEYVEVMDKDIYRGYLEKIREFGGGVKYSLSSMANTFFDDPNMSAYEFQQADYKQTQGYKDYVEQCVNNYRQTRADFDEVAARKAIEDSIDGIVKVAIAAKKAGYDIYDDPSKRDKKDSKKRLLFSSLEPNSEYTTSNDISTICDKRQNFAEIYDEIVRQEEAKGVPKGKRFFDNVDNYFAIHKIMADKGLTQPCRQCYVESMRKNLAPMANAFLKLVQETNPDNKSNDQLYHAKGKQKGELKTSNASTRDFVLNALELNPEYGMTVGDLNIETLTTADGLAQLKIQAPLVYEAFNSFYGQSKPKMPKGATPFRFGELTALLTDDKGRIKQSLVDKINATGGFRLQSYSDFQIQNYTDVLQVLFEAGTLGLKGHAYTKVPAFLEATEGTNLKRNISIFMYKDGNEWKIDRNDSFPYSLEEIYDIVNADESGNTSIIAVSQNAEMSAWIMANDNVGYGIPFHKSGMKMGTVRDTIVKEDGREIKGYSGIKDHTKQQTEVWAKTTADHKAETKVKKGINIYEFWDFENKGNLSKNELIEKNIKRYINECEIRGYLPKFREYVMNNDKVLKDTLRYAKELGFASPDATIDDISFTYKGYRIPYGYYKFLGDFGMFTPDGQVSTPKILSLENYDFDKAVKFFEDAESLRRNEILQQFSNGEERRKYRESNLSAEELDKIVKQKRGEVVDEVVNRKNSLSFEDEAPTRIRGGIYGEDVLLEDAPKQTVVEDVAPINSNVTNTNVSKTSKQSTKDAVKEIYAENGWGDISKVVVDEDTGHAVDIGGLVDGVFEQWNIGEGIKGNAIFDLLDKRAVYEDGELTNEDELHSIIEEKLKEVAPVYNSSLPAFAHNQFEFYKNAIAEERAKAKNNRKPSISEVKRLASTKSNRKEAHGVRTSDGKQYWSNNAFFVVESNNPDTTVTENESLAVDRFKDILKKANDNVSETKYKIDPIDISLVRKKAPKGMSIVAVRDAMFDVRYVDAVLKAIEKPEVQLTTLSNTLDALLIKGSNGQALVVGINPNANVRSANFVYKADEITDTNAPQTDVAPAAENIAPVKETVVEETPIAPIRSDVGTETVAPAAVNEPPIITTKQKIAAQVKASQTELEKNIQARKDSSDFYDKEIAHAQSLLDGKKNKNTKAAQALVRRIERLKRLKASEDANFEKRINDIESRVERLNDKSLSNHDIADRLERFKKRSEAKLEAVKTVLAQEFEQKRSKLQKEIADKDSYISNRASELYDEISNLKKGVRASKELGYLLDHGFEWKSIKTALVNAKHRPNQVVNVNSVAESTVREMLNEEYEGKVYELDEIDAEYNDEVSKLEAEAEKELEAFQVANRRNTKQQELSNLIENLVGDTSTWVDKKLGLQYKTNTLRRNLRDIVRDENGNKDIAKADAIYDELQGKYNHNEASLNRETNQIKKPYADMKFTKAEDAYIQMLGEFRHNPDTTLTKDVVEEFYNKHKDSIDVVKVDKAIDMARETYDSLLERVNEVLREQGMKEIPYRKGYFPHFTEDKQNWLAKLLNWKTQNNEIPTDIAGLTEQFNPNRSWQSFNKQRKTDTTDYSFSKGLDTYVQGSLDWIYHIEDIQKRRALENYIRYSHSEQGVKDKIDAIRQNDQYDADEMQEQIDLVYKNANNPLNNFVTDLRAGTNRLANKKSSLDRPVEEALNRKYYSTVTNLSNRVTANMVGGSISSALTNFIPITQSWGQVSPVSSLRAMGETIRSAFKNDGVVDKSDFLTNRLNTAENLYKTTWDKIGEKVSFLMDVVDNFTAQTVWRSKYLENINNGMSENTAIKDADQFAENVMAGRSRGNNPTIFDSKNPLIKTLTAFQLEVSNQYGYMLKDMPTDMRNETKAKLIKGYATMFIGAYVYNALYSSLTGRDAALDPIGIIEELLGDLFDDDEEETDAILNLVDNVVEEVPFVGGLMGGGRIPISSAMPYDGDLMKSLKGALDIFTLKDDGEATREWLKPVIYLGLPMGGGQIKKTLEGLSMFSDDHPIAGSYTDSGNLRFPVEDTIGNRIQAGIFGQWANKNAQTYLDEGYAPLDEKLVQEYKDVGMPINDYWEYRRGLNKYSTLAEKADYINSLNLTTEQKNILINNLSDRKEPIDMTNYGNYGSFDEFDFATKNPGKYTVSKVVGGYEAYKQYLSDLNNIKSDKDKYGNSITNSRKTKVIEYINGLDISYEDKIILYKSEYKSDDSFNYEIVKYLNSREDLSYNDIKSILTELGFHVDSKGNISWD